MIDAKLKSAQKSIRCSIKMSIFNIRFLFLNLQIKIGNPVIQQKESTNKNSYLLKPISEERFAKALSKWADKNAKPSESDIAVLPDLKTSETHKRIVVKSGNNIRIIPFEEIRYVEAYDDYIKIHILNDCFLKKQTMQKTEEMLQQHNFLRVHRSYIVQLDQISRIEALGKESIIAKLTDNTQIPLSKTGYSKLRDVLGL